MQCPAHLRRLLASTMLASTACSPDPAMESAHTPVVAGRPESGYLQAAYLLGGYDPAAVIAPGCGAALIASDVAVTAAHCAGYPALALGFGRYRGATGAAAVRTVLRHPRALSGAERYHHDLALLFLAAPVTDIATGGIAPAEARCNARYVGYGRVTAGGHEVSEGFTQERRSAGQCIEEIGTAHLLTRGTDGGLCWGDSGGALMVQGTSQVLGVLADFATTFRCERGNRMVFSYLHGERGFLECAIARWRAGALLDPRPFRDTVCDPGEPFVAALASQGVVRGRGDGTFAPGQPVTRAEFAVLVAAALAAQPRRPARPFTDVPPDHPAAAAIALATSAGYLAGLPDGRFEPDRALHRDEALAALATGLALPAADTAALDRFVDRASIPAWAEERLAAAVSHRLVFAYPVAEMLRPRAPARRGDVAVFLYQAQVAQGRAPAITSPYLVSP